MPDKANIMKLLQTLGGGSDSYSQGSQSIQNGQPLLPKPQMSMPDALSPYAPGNQMGGPHAHKGGYAFAANGRQPNSNPAKVESEMSDHADNHPMNQLAEYLTTVGGASARAASQRLYGKGTDPALFLKGNQGMQAFKAPVAGVRG